MRQNRMIQRVVSGILSALIISGGGITTFADEANITTNTAGT